jgi:hypothetical protein
MFPEVVEEHRAARQFQIADLITALHVMAHVSMGR